MLHAIIKDVDSISLVSIYLLKNSYSAKIRKLKILTRTGNVFMSDCSSLVASDGNIYNKLKVLTKAIDYLDFLYKFITKLCYVPQI